MIPTATAAARPAGLAGAHLANVNLMDDDVTDTLALPLALPFASKATAFSVYAPFGIAPVFHVAAKGAAVSRPNDVQAEPRHQRKMIEVIPDRPSVAVAVTLYALPVIVVPAAGAVMATDAGGVVSRLFGSRYALFAVFQLVAR